MKGITVTVATVIPQAKIVLESVTMSVALASRLPGLGSPPTNASARAPTAPMSTATSTVIQ